jgi:hypothetical protein
MTSPLPLPPNLPSGTPMPSSPPSRIYIVTAWSKFRSSIESRAWFWASSRERALEILKMDMGIWMEDGTFTHVIIEGFDEGSVLKPKNENTHGK